MAEGDDRLLALVAQRLAAHDQVYGKDWEPDRDGVRLGLAAIEDELREALWEWRGERQLPTWLHTRDEVLDVAAVCLRLLRALEPPPADLPGLVGMMSIGPDLSTRAKDIVRGRSEGPIERRD